MTIRELRKHFEKGTQTARQTLDGYLDCIDKKDVGIGAFLEVYAGEARVQADEVDAGRATGKPMGPLAGIPIALKDNILVQGKTASAGSHILEHYTASYSATVVERLMAAGAIIIGRCNMDEFACGSSTETSAFGVTKNPVDPTRVPGGSSGGSAAAVAAGFVPVALGSDTGGSIRQPAALCGVVGFKPTYGSVSRSGLIALASSLDQIGPLATSVGDIAEIMRVIAGPDPKDMTTRSVQASFPEFSGSVERLKIGVPKQFFDDALDPALASTVRAAIKTFADHGATIVNLDLPLLESALSVYYIIQPAEAASNLNRFDGMQYGTPAEGHSIAEQIRRTRTEQLGREVKRRILIGNYVLSSGYVDAYYKRAVALRGALTRQLNKAFDEVDVIMGPTSPITAWPLGEKFDDPLTMYLADIYTVVANLAGIPALSIPCGNVEGLPIGLQIMGRAGADSKVLDVGWFWESVE